MSDDLGSFPWPPMPGTFACVLRRGLGEQFPTPVVFGAFLLEENWLDERNSSCIHWPPRLAYLYHVAVGRMCVDSAPNSEACHHRP